VVRILKFLSEFVYKIGIFVYKYEQLFRDSDEMPKKGKTSKEKKRKIYKFASFFIFLDQLFGTPAACPYLLPSHPRSLNLASDATPA